MTGVVWSESDSRARRDKLVSRDGDDRRDRHGKVKGRDERIRGRVTNNDTVNLRYRKKESQAVRTSYEQNPAS